MDASKGSVFGSILFFFTAFLEALILILLFSTLCHWWFANVYFQIKLLSKLLESLTEIIAVALTTLLLQLISLFHSYISKICFHMAPDYNFKNVSSDHITPLLKTLQWPFPLSFDQGYQPWLCWHVGLENSIVVAFLCIAECLATSLMPLDARSTPQCPYQVVTTKNVARRCQMSHGGQKYPILRTTA